MIKVEKEKIEIKGSPIILLSELSAIIHSFKKGNIAPEEVIKYSIEIGFEDDEKINKKAKEAHERLLKNGHLGELLRGLYEMRDSKDDI